jgi:hypothetical protein
VALARASVLPLVLAGQLVAPGARATPAAPPAQPAAIAPVRAVTADSVVDGFGVGIHLAFLDTPYRDAAAVATKLSALGVRHVRDDLFMDNQRQYDAIATVAATGARFDLILGRPTSGHPPAEYVDTVATRLPAGSVESLEGANEWDISGREGWVDEVRTWQAALYDAAKRNPATAGLPVLSPALAHRWNHAALGDVSATADVANAHMYAGGYLPSNEITRITAAVRSSVPGRPLVTTEAGYHNALAAAGGHRPVPEDVAGVYAPRLLLEHLVRGEQRMYSYELIDEFADPDLDDPEAHFGLLRHDLTPKPSFLAMQSLLSLLSDRGPAFTPGSLEVAVDGFPGDGRYLLTQQRSGRFVLLLWRDVPVYDPVAATPEPVSPVAATVRLGSPASMTVHRPSDGSAPVAEAVADSLPLQLDGQVTAITIDPARPADPAAASGPAVVAGTAPGRPAVTSARVVPRGVRLAWRAPDDGGRALLGYQVRVGRRVVDLPATVRVTTVRLATGHRPRVRVRARNELGWGPWSRPVVARAR